MKKKLETFFENSQFSIRKVTLQVIIRLINVRLNYTTPMLIPVCIGSPTCNSDIVMVFLSLVETLAEAGKHAHEQQISQASLAAQVIYAHIVKAQAGLVQLPHLQF